MVSVPTLCLIAALALGAYDTIRSKGQSLCGWGITLIALALLWPLVR